MDILSLRTCIALFLCLLISVSVVAQSPTSLESRRKALNDLLAEQWEYRLRTSPIFASTIGDKRWNDKLDDRSQEAIDKDLQEAQKFLTRFEAIDISGFHEQEAFNEVLMVRDLQMQLEGARFKPGKCRSIRKTEFISSCPIWSTSSPSNPPRTLTTTSLG